MASLEHLEHLQLLLQARITQAEADHEAIELGLGQRKRAFVIDRVLRADHQEGAFQIVRRAVDRDATFAHRFQQRGLRARGGPIDFIGQHDLRKHRSGAKLEVVGLGIEDRSPGDVGGQQVGRTLNAFERTAHAGGERAGQHRLGDARHVFEQHVTFAKPGDQREHDLRAFADDHGFDVADNFFGRCGNFRHSPLMPRIGCPNLSREVQLYANPPADDLPTRFEDWRAGTGRIRGTDVGARAREKAEVTYRAARPAGF